MSRSSGLVFEPATVRCVLESLDLANDDLANELRVLMAGKPALVVERQSPIALEIQGLMLDHGASDVRVASSLGDARRFLAEGFRPRIAVIDIVRFDADADDLIAFLMGEQVGLVLTMASDDGPRPEAGDRTIVLTKPYFEAELMEALAVVLREARA